VRILVVSPDLPFPPVSGSETRTYELVRALAQRHEVVFVGFSWGGEPAARPPFPVRVVDVRWDWPPLYREMNWGSAASAREAAELLASEGREPWLVSMYESERMEQALRVVAQEPIDLALVEQTPAARFLSALPDDVPAVVDFHNVHSLIALRSAERTSAPADEQEAKRTLRFERSLAARCDLCVTVSEPEAAAARALLGFDSVEVVPNGVDTSFFTPTGEGFLPGYLLFTGLMNYGPNVEAVRYFADEILPLVRANLPDAELHVVGAKPGEEVLALESEALVVHGRVADMRPFYSRAETVVVPLLSGGGTRVKILEAAAAAKPIVTTSLGMEGLSFVPGRDLVVADSPTEFAAAVRRLAGDRERRAALGRNARRVAESYDWRPIGDRLCDVVERRTPVKRRQHVRPGTGV
jgi:polysaccharide biosynthesis protein PslH